jgi:TRAP-type C4-dicarboxylate transport system permease small subunit
MRALTGLAALLVLPLALLLFAQWPLREWVQAGSREANDAAQILFALYVAVAVSAATRHNAHLSTASHLEPHQTPASSWRRWAAALCVLPWAGFMLWAAAPQILASVRQLEKFSETLNPGYFLIRLALGLLVLLVVVDAAYLLRQSSRHPNA